MPRIVKCGLIQATHACGTQESIDTIREANVAKHVDLVEQAGREGVQILCMQEIFTGPYFCAEQSARWYDAVEAIPDGPTTRLMQDVAKKYGPRGDARRRESSVAHTAPGARRDPDCPGQETPLEPIASCEDGSGRPEYFARSAAATLLRHRRNEARFGARPDFATSSGCGLTNCG